jgi:transcriptional regulator with XRE-family HTH domain
LAFQIRSLRGDLSQGEVAEKLGVKQQAISRLESPNYGKASVTTLKKIANTFDVGLLIEFVPFSELINRVSGTPYVERGFRPETMNIPSFEEEEKQNVLDTPDFRATTTSQLTVSAKQQVFEPPAIAPNAGEGEDVPLDISEPQKEGPPLFLFPKGSGGLSSSVLLPIGGTQ